MQHKSPVHMPLARNRESRSIRFAIGESPCNGGVIGRKVRGAEHPGPPQTVGREFAESEAPNDFAIGRDLKDPALISRTDQRATAR